MTQAVQPRKNVKKLTSEEIREMKKKDHRMVKGIFRCYEPPGGNITFNFRKYPGDPVTKYSMTDGETYEVPLMVAKHLNQNCWYPRHSYVLDMNGNPSVQVGKKVNRCSFESLEFAAELDEYPS